MANQGSKDKSARLDNPTRASTPDTVLAQKVIDALVANGLLAEPDGTKILVDLAAGKVDAARWKLVLENQLEREARADEPK